MEKIANHDYQSMARASITELEKLLTQGILPDMDHLAGSEFKGFNRPEFTKYLGIRKFIKGFYKDEAENPEGICGYNVQVQQTPLEGPWDKKMKNGQPITHGYYHVFPVQESLLDNLYPNALLLDYGKHSGNPRMDPSRCLRDYLVQVYEGNPDLLLGKAYFALSTNRVFVSFFLLERLPQN